MHYRINNRSFHLKRAILSSAIPALHSGEMENQEDCSYIPITFDPKLIYGFFQSTICTRYVDPVIQNLAVCAVHIDYSEKWHETFRDRMLEVISLVKKSRISMNWIFPFGCSSCGGCLWNTFRISLYQLFLFHRIRTIRRILSYIEQNYMIRLHCGYFRTYSFVRE